MTKISCSEQIFDVTKAAKLEVKGLVRALDILFRLILDIKISSPFSLPPVVEATRVKLQAIFERIFSLQISIKLQDKMAFKDNAALDKHLADHSYVEG